MGLCLYIWYSDPSDSFRGKAELENLVEQVETVAG